MRVVVLVVMMALLSSAVCAAPLVRRQTTQSVEAVPMDAEAEVNSISGRTIFLMVMSVLVFIDVLLVALVIRLKAAAR